MRTRGFTLVELLASIAVASIVLASLGMAGNLIGTAADRQRVERLLATDAEFALGRMQQATARSQRLLLPLHDRPTTEFAEHIREQHVPAQPPPAGTTFATAVLAMTQDPALDLDYDGIPDADNDGDGRIDEDWPSDVNDDEDSGVTGLDDDGDGDVDERILSANDDDELLALNEDPVNGVDDDGDGSIDEDSESDMNNDSEPGIAGVDDDGDGSVDEGSDADDDEDGVSDEDWLDTRAFYISGSDLIERVPVPWDEDGDLSISGTDFVESVVANNVSFFGVQLTTDAYAASQLLEITLTLTDATGIAVTRSTRVRMGAEL